jgi:hypothetical protein
MLKFFGFDLELFVDATLDHDALVHSAHDFRGEHWLIILADRDPDHLIWVCAPVSVRALQEVTSGKATAGDAARHSSTGMVEVVTVDHGRAVPDRCVCCAAVSSLLPAEPIDGPLVAA